LPYPQQNAELNAQGITMLSQYFISDVGVVKQAARVEAG